MSPLMRALRAAPIVLGALVLATARAQVPPPSATSSPIDLPTTLRLAGAQNLDVEIARQALAEAEAHRQSALERFFPWLDAGIVYHRRNGLAQAVPGGTISETNFDSYAPGGTLVAEVVLGDAIYNDLAARQLVRASDEALAAEVQDATLSAARGYFELAKRTALVAVARQALETSQAYERQLHEAVAIGIAFKGDELRVQTQTQRYEIALRQAAEQERLAAADLTRILHLDPLVELAAQDASLTPITLFERQEAADVLIDRALHARPEVKQRQALVSASRADQDGAVYGPLIPTIGAQAFVGGLGGGHAGQSSTFGTTQDYTVGLSWRIGPGGLLDLGRIDATTARLESARAEEAKLRDAVAAQVVESVTRARSLADQIDLAKQNLATADDTLRLTRERKQYGVGIVLEDIQAQQALTQARADYVATIAEYNTAQYALNKALGGPEEPAARAP